MAEIAHVVADEAVKSAAESGPGWLQTSMNIIIKCDHKDLKLKFNNHLVKGGFVSQAPDQNVGYTNEIDVGYISNTIRKKFEGVLICQVQSESELPDDTFIMVGWDAPLIGSARIYTFLAETRNEEVKWDSKSMRDLHKSFHTRFKKYTRSIAESWSLGNNIKIKLITDLGGDKDYYLKIVICENELNDEGHLPVQIAPKGQT
jgi:hypothetical protein